MSTNKGGRLTMTRIRRNNESYDSRPEMGGSFGLVNHCGPLHHPLDGLQHEQTHT